MTIIEYQHPIGPGLTMVCELEYYPADPGQPNPELGDCCPPSPAETYLIKACIKCADGCLVDVTPLISDELRDMIELTARADL